MNEFFTSRVGRLSGISALEQLGQLLADDFGGVLNAQAPLPPTIPLPMAISESANKGAFATG